MHIRLGNLRIDIQLIQRYQNTAHNIRLKNQNVVIIKQILVATAMSQPAIYVPTSLEINLSKY